MPVWWSSLELEHVPWVMLDWCSLCCVPMGWLMCLPIRPVTVLCLYGNLRVGAIPASLYFNNNHQKRKKCCSLWVQFCKQLNISSFHYLGERMFWLESWGKLYILFWELNVTTNNTYVIDLLKFSYSVTSSNFIVFSVFILVYSFIIIAHVPENCLQNILREIRENNEQLKKTG